MGFLRSLGNSRLVSAPFNMVKSFLHPEAGYEAAGNETQHAFEMLQNFLRPYQNAGLNQIAPLEGASSNLMHPDEMLNKWISGYQESPYAKQLTEQSTQAGLQDASQQGLLGSSAALNNVQSTASNITNADRQNYLQDLMNKYMQGVGVSQNLYGTGATAGGQLGQGAFNTGENMAQSRELQLNSPGMMLQKLIGLIAGAASGKPGAGSAALAGGAA